MNVEEEIYRLRGESMAVQSVAAFVFSGLVELGDPFKTIVAYAFDHADQVVESGAFQFTEAGAKVHIHAFATVLEQLREIVLGRDGDPKQDV